MMSKSFQEWWNKTGYNVFCAKTNEPGTCSLPPDSVQNVIKIAEMAWNENLMADMAGLRFVDLSPLEVLTNAKH